MGVGSQLAVVDDNKRLRKLSVLPKTWKIWHFGTYGIPMIEGNITQMFMNYQPQ